MKSKLSISHTTRLPAPSRPIPCGTPWQNFLENLKRYAPLASLALNCNSFAALIPCFQLASNVVLSTK